MKTSFNAIAAALGGLALALLLAPNSKAQCATFPRQGVAPADWHAQSGQSQPRLLRAAYTSNDEANARDESRSPAISVVMNLVSASFGHSPAGSALRSSMRCST